MNDKICQLHNTIVINLLLLLLINIMFEECNVNCLLVLGGLPGVVLTSQRNWRWDGKAVEYSTSLTQDIKASSTGNPSSPSIQICMKRGRSFKSFPITVRKVDVILKGKPNASF